MASPVIVPRRRSMFAPVVLIGLGVVVLLINMGTVSFGTAMALFAKYWPLIIILWGLFKLYEHTRAKQEGLPSPGIGAGGVIFLIFFIVTGLAVSSAYRNLRGVNWNEVGDELQVEGMDFGNMFGQRYEFTQTLEQAFPAGGSLNVVADRGTLRIVTSPDDKVHVSVRKIIRAESQDQANKKNSAVNPEISVAGTIVTINSARKNSDWEGVTTDLEISLPRKANLELRTGRGDIEVRDREGNIEAHSMRGNMTLASVTGNANLHVKRGDVDVRSITGDVRVEGRADDVSVADVSGVLDLQGDFFGNVNVEKIAKGVRFKSSRTDLEFARLNGSFVMDSGDLRADGVAGPLRLDTRSKDIHLEDVSGDVHLENRNGEVELHPDPKSPLGNIEISNKSGAIRVTLPSTANFQLDARALRGEIETDFDSIKPTDNDREARATGTVNKGGSRLQLSTEHGTIMVLRREGSLAKEQAEDSDSHDAEDQARKAERDARRIADRAKEDARRIEEQAREVERKARERAKPEPPDSPR
jgi:DUF4097 and DUF4098 domain-containing protein YvlB